LIKFFERFFENSQLKKLMPEPNETKNEPEMKWLANNIDSNTIYNHPNRWLSQPDHTHMTSLSLNALTQALTHMHAHALA
jgi:hypothetical protein